MAQKQGALIFDVQTDRYDIRFDLADYYGGLHCGECFDVMIGGKWKPTRIEMSFEQEWYLVFFKGRDADALTAAFKEFSAKKLIIPNIPYLLFAYLFDKAAQAFRLAPGADFSGRLLSIGDGFTGALAKSIFNAH